MVDVIVDSAGQKGTGRWSAIEALHLAAPASAIEAAVAARTLSSLREEREAGALQFGGAKAVAAEPDLGALEAALLAGKIACYAQGFGILAAASVEFGWNLPLAEIARIWRAGCIIRSAMLDEMAAALEEAPEVNLMFAPGFAAHMAASHGHLRAVVAQAALAGVPVPAVGAALAYFDTMRSARTTANLIQGQRDFFGAHGFARLDRQGTHHGPWSAASESDPHRPAPA
jgi:6-phosphogluconate dehydrogenase